MSQMITAIYENGVLRPLTPLELPDHTEVLIRLETVLERPEAETHRREVDRVLTAAGLMLPRVTDHPSLLTDAARAALSRRIPAGRPLSEIIVEERAER